MIFNTSNEQGAKALREQTEKFISGGVVVDIKKVIQTRSNRQNRALWLFFQQVAEELNSLGITYVYRGLISGTDVEVRWTKNLFHDMTWIPIQRTMYGTESTKKLKRDQIDPIFEVINNWFAEKGIEVSFPNEFDLYLKMYKG